MSNRELSITNQIENIAPLKVKEQAMRLKFSAITITAEKQALRDRQMKMGKLL